MRTHKSAVITFSKFMFTSNNAQPTTPTSNNIPRNAAAERILSSEFGEAQRDEELTGEDDRPRPHDGWSRFAKAEVKILHDPGQDREV